LGHDKPAKVVMIEDIVQLEESSGVGRPIHQKGCGTYVHSSAETKILNYV